MNYQQTHAFVRKIRGSAADFACADDCGEMAVEWSWIHDTDKENPAENYSPRCRSCHFKYDGHLEKCFTYDRSGNKNASGKHENMSGSDNPASKLTEENIPEIRDLYKSGLFNYTKIGAMYGVNRSVISRIIAGKIWSHA